ncbi:cytochrome C oxidase subunit II [Paenibacillus swuensis]|uniref:Cytochrome C oxidase subunit II n=1 Tax=Paenibacillus swuensis TaxID=1178515 RepID=A0A172TMS3_9BACL|nr:cupredoxin domain-containing protein [Paenibacillus swuensis]ANE48341.1 cytochrome C oxidase subunit II [Paenibacillus swuensis]
MHKWVMATLCSALVVLSLVLMTVGLPKAEEAESPEEAANTLKIVASNFKFDQQEYKVKAGETKTVKLQNKLGKHGVEIQGLDVKLDENNPEKEVTFDKPGTYELVCSVMCGEGHMDMKSVLIVE